MNRRAASFALTALAVSLPAPALADVTSWLALGGGYGEERDRVTHTRDRTAVMTYSLGVGTTPLAPVVVGGIVRGTTFVAYDAGTDLSLAARVCTGSFARGEWGVAIEAGVAWRPFESGYGEWPLQGVLSVGAPWGFQLAVGADVWSASGGVPAQGVFGALEIDLLRLTVMRQGPTERWWPNPMAAGGHSAQ